MTTIISYNPGVINKAPFLRTSRIFPQDLDILTQEINKMYIETASAVNNRTISIFSTTIPAINGESWYLSGNQRQQAFRQVYTFTSFSTIEIGFKLSSISQPVRLFGEYTDGLGNWYGIIWGTSVGIVGQISMYLFTNNASTTSDQIILVNGGGAPGFTYGSVILEWIANP